MSKEILEYVDWKTGKEKNYELNSYNNIVEQIIGIVCPVDLTPLIFAYDHLDKWVECVNCGQEHLNSNQEEIYKYAKDILMLECKDWKEIEQKRNDLIARIKQAEKMRVSSG